MVKLTKAQRRALFTLYQRNHPEVVTPFKDAYGRKPSGGYRQFRRQVFPFPADSCVMVPWCNMIVGIETDGYTHS